MKQLLLLLLAAHVAVVAEAQDLKTLRPEHPRLMVVREDWARISTAIKNNALAGKWYDSLYKEAEKILTEPPVERVFRGGRTLLDESRRVLHRVTRLAAIYRLSGEERFARRAKTEMFTAAGFVDWNPPVFLDVAEMTAALAIGYDWLYDDLSAEERRTIRTAIVEKGLKHSLPIYEKNSGWSKVKHNWNLVCNGGMTVGVLAVAEDEPKLAERIVAAALKSIPVAMATFAPDGGWDEGPGYWNYATKYIVFHLASLQTALGSDFGFKQSPGFSQTGLFYMHLLGPTQKTFNYADAGSGEQAAPQMLWLAREFNQPIYAAYRQKQAESKPTIFDLLWYAPIEETKVKPLPPNTLFRGVNVAFLRSSWEDPNALFVGFKGGDNKANHAHLDLGSFVFDARGYRWAQDLGGDNYGLPGYFGKRRWTYYRTRTESHNTLVLDGKNQELAKAPVVAFSDRAERAFAVVDLTAAYAPNAMSVKRGIAMLCGKSVLVQDEIETREPAEVVWNFLTHAKIKANKTTALLQQGKETLRATILSPTNACFVAIPAAAPKPQAQQKDVQNLTVRLSEKIKKERIAVLLAPVDGDETAAIEPLSEWIARGKLPEER